MIDAPKRKAIDWEAVEMQYRAGIRSLKEIGAEFGVSDAGIIKRAKRDGWVRDLKAKIQAKAEAKVSAAAVSELVSAERKQTEQTIVEVNAQAVANVRLAHRTDIARSRNLGMSLLQELENNTFNQDLFEQLGELVIGPPIFGDDPSDKAAERRRQKLQDAFDKALSLPSRVDSMKKLSESLRVLVTMEREAFGITSAPQQPGSGEEGEGPPAAPEYKLNTDEPLPHAPIL